MILSCVVCDDIQQEAEIAKERILKAYKNRDFTCEVSVYTKGHHLMSIIESNRNIHLLVLDIEMPDISGIELAKALKQLRKHCVLILLTSHSEYAVDGYELGVFRFIPKDRMDEMFEKALMDAADKIIHDYRKIFLIQHHSSIEKIFFDEINYITKDGKNSIIHLTNKQTLTVRKTLSNIFEELNSKEFIFIDRGCIANIDNVWKVDKKNWICSNGIVLPMSGTVRTTIKETLFEYWGSTFI